MLETPAAKLPARWGISDWEYVNDPDVDYLVELAQRTLVTGMSLTGCTHMPQRGIHAAAALDQSIERWRRMHPSSVGRYVSVHARTELHEERWQEPTVHWTREMFDSFQMGRYIARQELRRKQGIPENPKDRPIPWID